MWLHGCNLLVQDYERCPRCPEPLQEVAHLRVRLVHDYPKCSQDLNATENAWALLRGRLNYTRPNGMESRQGFIPRSRAAVRWLNANRRAQLFTLCTNQKARAQEVLHLRGSRTSW